MQSSTKKFYTFWVGNNQDYTFLKQAIIQIEESLQKSLKISSLTREKILAEMEMFDWQDRADSGPNGWFDWENSSRVTGGRYKYAIRYKGQLYPPRLIFNRAVGGDQDYTTNVARRNLTNLGFEVITLDNSNDLWPSQVEGPCFVLMHQHEDELQRYGETYTFNLGGTGGKKDLAEALQAQKAGGPAVSAIIYLPGNHPLTGRPHKAFTAWARVRDWEPMVEEGVTHIVARLEHHEFPVPLYIQGNASDLVEKLDWLDRDLRKTFWQRSIRKISDTDFKIIIEEAKKAAGEEMNLGDAAYAVLFEANGSLPLAEIADRMVKQGLVNQPPKATDLANTLLLDGDRFMSVGQNRWDLVTRSLEPALPDGFETLREYWEFVDTLQMGRSYTAEEIYQLAGGVNAETNPESFVMGLRQLRLLRYNPATSRYELQPYATSEGDDFKEYIILRLMALGLLVAQKADDTFSLPAREIIPRLYGSKEAQPAANFAPELKWENDKLLGWYAGAALVEYDPQEGTWKGNADALADIPGDAPAILAYNQLVNALRRTYLEGWGAQVDSFGPLSPVENFSEKLRELQKKVLVDDQTVLRIYRSLLAGHHVILSGPPGTGKTLLAEKLPEILWREEKHTILPGTDPDGPLVLDRPEVIHGYRAVFVTATEDWSVRDVIGGISPRLGGSEGDGKMSYDIRYGALTGTVLKNYKFTDEGKKLPVDTARPQRDYITESDLRYRGAWLVIDEFNRAHIDAAFGSLLTTLSGKFGTTLAVPARGSEVTELRMPDDFRIIGTLNSFDRHFLNQISEALKRRFDFIDILPPRPDRYEQELVISMQGALGHLHRNKLGQIELDAEGDYSWPGVIGFVRDGNRLELFVDNDAASVAIEDFRRIFAVIRFFRKLGTAQVVAVLTNLFTGVLVGMDWSDALDVALADSLADQLQVLTPEEQGILESYLEDAGQPASFAKAVQAQLQGHRNRRSRVVSLLREADILQNGSSPIDPQSDTPPTEAQLVALFRATEPLHLPNGYFLRRLRDLNSDRGI
ncbi:MAG: AAA family ATPase [Chloroflexi bacterium]|nr:AAA family ATPase [Chloroflexota bacterium]